MQVNAEKILTFIIPWFAGVFLSIVGWIGKSLYDISQSLSVVVYQIKDHNERITNLEDWRNGNSPGPRRNR